MVCDEIEKERRGERVRKGEREVGETCVWSKVVAQKSLPKLSIFPNIYDLL